VKEKATCFRLRHIGMVVTAVTHGRLPPVRTLVSVGSHPANVYLKGLYHPTFHLLGGCYPDIT